MKVSKIYLPHKFHYTKMKFSIKDFFSKCDQIRRKLRVYTHLLKKCLMENFFGGQCLAQEHILQMIFCLFEEHCPHWRVSVLVVSTLQF